MVKKSCVYCGSTWNPEKDHIKPKSKGGVKTAIACKEIYQKKSN